MKKLNLTIFIGVVFSFSAIQMIAQSDNKTVLARSSVSGKKDTIANSNTPVLARTSISSNNANVTVNQNPELKRSSKSDNSVEKNQPGQPQIIPDEKKKSSESLHGSVVDPKH